MVKYYTPEEVAIHNNADDCWISIYERIYDLTKLISENRGILADPIIKNAGSSISHWFKEDTGDVKTFIDPERNILMAYTPYGRFIHVPSPDPVDNCAIVDIPWWDQRSSSYIIGQLTVKKRMVKIANMLTRTDDVINTCQEETINEIRDRYVEYNRHAQSYTWKVIIKDEFVNLNMNLTLTENGVEDESAKFLELGMDEDFYLPTLHIYFNDDLTYA